MTIELFVAGVTFGISIFKTIIQQRGIIQCGGL